MGPSGAARPLTSIKGAGFQAGRSGGPGNMAMPSGPAPPLLEHSDLSPMEEARSLERRVHELLESSAEAASRADAGAGGGGAQLALERAKEAGKKERQLEKFLEKPELADSEVASGIAELSSAVLLNLARCYAACKQGAEALSTYTLVLKGSPRQGAKIRVAMGNVYFEQKQYPAAIKQYRMALDMLPSTAGGGHPGSAGDKGRESRLKIQKNIGHAHVRMGAYAEAIPAYEAIMESAPDFQVGFNLLLCYYALGDTELMQAGFKALLAVPLPVPEGEEEEERGMGGARGGTGHDSAREDEDLLAGLDTSRDALHEELAERQRVALTYVLTAAKLIAPVPGLGKGSSASARAGASSLDPSSSDSLDAWVCGYDWCISQLRVDYPSLASEMEISRALTHMKKGNYKIAMDELKEFEKKDVKLKARAAVNLSFLYLLEGDISQAAKNASLAVQTDRYNARALVNMGNCVLEEEWAQQGGQGEADIHSPNVARAKDFYLEAIGVEADCCEAIYNLGLVNKRTGQAGEALQAFEKLHTLVPSSPEVLYQLATMHEAQGSLETAVKYWKHLSARVPNDAGVLRRLGEISDAAAGEGGQGGGEAGSDAFHFYAESYRAWPLDLQVLSRLGMWHVQQELYEQAVELFTRGSEVQPGEASWRLMVASCHRRSGAIRQALSVYASIHAAWPDNMECLRYLVALSRELRREGEAERYGQLLEKLERAAGITEAAQQRYREQQGGSEYGVAGAPGAGSVGAQLAVQRGGPGQAVFGAPALAPAFDMKGGGEQGQEARDEFEGADIDDLLA